MLLPAYWQNPGKMPGNEWGSELTASTILSVEQSRRTASAVFARIEEKGYASTIVALGLLAELCPPQCDTVRLPADPLLHSTRVTGEGLCRHRAIRREFSATDRVGEALDPHIETLRRTALVRRSDPADCDWAVPNLRPRHGDILFDIVRVKEWSDPREWCSSSVSWLVRGGQWAYWRMNRNGRILLCRIASACVYHDVPERVALTMKLGLHLGFSALLRGDEGPLDLSVAEILRQTGVPPSGREAGRDSPSPTYFEFRQALSSLCEADVLADIVLPAAGRSPAMHETDAAPDGWMEWNIQLKPAVIPVPPAGGTPRGQLEIPKI